MGPDEDDDGTDEEAHSRTISPVDDGTKKEAAITLSENLKTGEPDYGYEMTLVNRLPNGQTQQDNSNGFKYSFGESCRPL